MDQPAGSKKLSNIPSQKQSTNYININAFEGSGASNWVNRKILTLSLNFNKDSDVTPST